uniref:DnaJ heat shock protein family (Hsp40) member C5 gamma n=1 Tax=Rhinolophus ferrumequinum TaxID=59479 RepID=A0A671F168_RHIFE
MSHVNEATYQLSKSGTTLYAVLELQKGASPEDIKKAYRHSSSFVLCSAVAVAAAAAVFAVEHLSHLRRARENSSRMSKISLPDQETKEILERKTIIVKINIKR